MKAYVDDESSCQQLSKRFHFFSVTECHIWPAFHTVTMLTGLQLLSTVKICENLRQPIKHIRCLIIKGSGTREVLIFPSRTGLIMCRPLSTAWVHFNILVLTFPVLFHHRWCSFVSKESWSVAPRAGENKNFTAELKNCVFPTHALLRCFGGLRHRDTIKHQFN